MKKVTWILITLFLVVSLFFSAFGSAKEAQAQKAKPIILKCVTFKPAATQFEPATFVRLFVNKVNERSKGELTIKVLGSTEVIPMTEQALAVKRGVVDMSFNAAGLYKGLAPGAELLGLSEITPEEERARGAYDYVQELHNKDGLFLLGRASANRPAFHMGLKKKVARPQELAGLSLSGGATIAPYFMQALGVVCPRIPSPDWYTALERGTVDGWVFTLESARMYNFNEVTKFIIDEGFLTNVTTIIMNLNGWNRLPKHLQDLLLEVQSEFVKEATAVSDNVTISAKQQLVNKGMEVIKFSKADTEWFMQLSVNAQWEGHEKDYPEAVAKLRPLLTK